MTLTEETHRILDGIDENVFTEKEEEIAALFRDVLIREDLSYETLWHELASYSDEQISPEIEDEIRYADDKAGAAALGGVLRSYLHRHDLPHESLDEVYGEIR